MATCNCSLYKISDIHPAKWVIICATCWCQLWLDEYIVTDISGLAFASVSPEHLIQWGFIDASPAASAMFCYQYGAFVPCWGDRLRERGDNKTSPVIPQMPRSCRSKSILLNVRRTQVLPLLSNLTWGLVKECNQVTLYAEACSHRVVEHVCCIPLH